MSHAFTPYLCPSNFDAEKGEDNDIGTKAIIFAEMSLTIENGDEKALSN